MRDLERILASGALVLTLACVLLLYDELVRFDQAMDQSLAEAVSWFNEGVERARDVFVGVLGHDLRDPLGVAKSAAELQSLCDDDPEQRSLGEDTTLPIITASMTAMQTSYRSRMSFQPYSNPPSPFQPERLQRDVLHGSVNVSVCTLARTIGVRGRRWAIDLLAVAAVL